MNAGAALISDIYQADPAITITTIVTAAAHNFITGAVVTIKVPLQNGLQSTTAAAYQYEDLIESNVINVTDPTTFEMPINLDGLTAFSNSLPCYATPDRYSCYQYTKPTFAPTYRLISNVTNAFPAAVTTSLAHGLLTGAVVRLIMPAGVGMTQLNNMSGVITVTGTSSFTIDIDTSSFDAFTVYGAAESSDPHVNICALVLPIGESLSGANSATYNTLLF